MSFVIVSIFIEWINSMQWKDFHSINWLVSKNRGIRKYVFFDGWMEQLSIIKMKRKMNKPSIVFPFALKYNCYSNVIIHDSHGKHLLSFQYKINQMWIKSSLNKCFLNGLLYFSTLFIFTKFSFTITIIIIESDNESIIVF